ncbi:MAG: citrate lyase acyl carrier protein [Clostridiales bacterium]|nr:citrate lyase acyl carrier protein [Clostridiales bacterium]
MKRGIAGSLESNDALITVKESDTLNITIKSIVYDFFHEQIEKVIRDTLAELGIKKIDVTCEDKGALDYTIKARLTVAIARMTEEK